MRPRAWSVILILLSDTQDSHPPLSYDNICLHIHSWTFLYTRATFLPKHLYSLSLHSGGHEHPNHREEWPWRAYMEGSVVVRSDLLSNTCHPKVALVYTPAALKTQTLRSEDLSWILKPKGSTFKAFPRHQDGPITCQRRDGLHRCLALPCLSWDSICICCDWLVLSVFRRQTLTKFYHWDEGYFSWIILRSSIVDFFFSQ